MANFEERKNRRISIAAQPGTMVFAPKSTLSYNSVAYMRLIDRAAYKLQNELFQPNSNKQNIEKAKKLMEEYLDSMRKTAQEMSELSGLKFYDPEENSNK